MAKTKLSLSKRTLLEKIALTGQIVGKMTGNPAFPPPLPMMAPLTMAAGTAQTAYNEAQAARTVAQEKTAVQNDTEAVLDAQLSALASYVDALSGGDEQVILSAGMGIRGDKTSAAMPGQILALAASAGDADGSIDLVWDPRDEARSYSIELSTVSGTGPWTPPATNAIVIRSSATIGTTATGSRVWFRVAAVGVAGQGPWSDPATKIVP